MDVSLSDCIGVEDVPLDLCDGVQCFVPSAVPKHAAEFEMCPPLLRLLETEVCNKNASRKDSGLALCCAHQPAVCAEGGVLCARQLVDGLDSAAACESTSPKGSAFSITSNILRGVDARAVLRRRAELLANSNSSATTYQLSQEVDHLLAFISHNWSVSRRKKWLALSLYYNSPVAWFGGLLTTAIFALATCWGVLPLAPTDNGYVKKPEGPFCRVFGFFVFHVLFFFGPDVLPQRVMRHKVFLDKACIHQTDENLKLEGIRSLGGFLFYSWSLVVLYSRVYTQKVWTVYEMACLLCAHPEGRLVWLPVSLPPSVLVGSVVVWFQLILGWLSRLVIVRENVPFPGALVNFVSVPVAYAVAHLFRTVAREQALSYADLRLFSIRKAICAVESDRAVVEGNVVSLMRDLSCVPYDCSDEDALATFDDIVQRTMPRVIRASLGLAGVRYELVSTISAAMLFASFDVTGGYIAGGFGGSRGVCIWHHLAYQRLGGVPAPLCIVHAAVRLLRAPYWPRGLFLHHPRGHRRCPCLFGNLLGILVSH